LADHAHPSAVDRAHQQQPSFDAARLSIDVSLDLEMTRGNGLTQNWP
jgi:hypothetical protein